MASAGQIRGMLLEEAILFLLRHSGYRIVTLADRDPTLREKAAGLYVLGRGSEHQIDAIADFRVHQPFSNPQRLLVEGKCFDARTRTGLEVVRNAVGVLKDVSEFWVSGTNQIGISQRGPARQRYHYQYAVFSATPFTKPSQDYAYSQDIYLLPLMRSAFLRNLVAEIRQCASRIHESVEFEYRGVFRRVRQEVRTRLNPSLASQSDNSVSVSIPDGLLDEFLRACDAIGSCLLAMLTGRLPILLVPSSNEIISQLEPRQDVTITWDEDNWYLNRRNGERLFSFDLPDELFTLYARDGQLGERRAIAMKREFMASMQAIRAMDSERPPQLIEFVLDRDWIAQIEERLG